MSDAETSNGFQVSLHSALTSQQHEILLREAQSHELPEVAKLVKDTLENFPEAGDVLASTFKRLHNLPEIMQNHDIKLYIAISEQSNFIVGAAFFGPLAGLPISEGIGEIRDLVIDKNYRRCGLGRKLLVTILGKARDLGYHRIYLETTPQMEPAQQLFKSVGFKPLKHHEYKQNKITTDKSAFPCYFVLEKLV